jgi:hypothetical protein
MVKGSGTWALLLFLTQSLVPVSVLSRPALAQGRDSIDIQDLVRRAAANHKARKPLQNDYTYLAHCVWSRFDVRTKPASPASDDYEIMIIEGEPYMRLIRVNGRPLTPDEEKRQTLMTEAFAKARREAKSKPGGLPYYYTALQLPIALLADQYDLRSRGHQQLDGRDVQVIDALPRDRQPPANAEEEHARHFKMRLWINTAEAQIVKIEGGIVRDVMVTDIPTISDPTFSYPTFNNPSVVSEPMQIQFLYKRGTTMTMEWTKLSDGAWLPKRTRSRGKYRLWLGLPNSTSYSDWLDSGDWTYYDYKKFRVNSTILP